MAHFKEVALTQLQGCNPARMQTLWDQNFLFFFPKKEWESLFCGELWNLGNTERPSEKACEALLVVLSKCGHLS